MIWLCWRDVINPFACMHTHTRAHTHTRTHTHTHTHRNECGSSQQSFSKLAVSFATDTFSCEMYTHDARQSAPGRKGIRYFNFACIEMCNIVHVSCMSLRGLDNVLSAARHYFVPSVCKRSRCSEFTCILSLSWILLPFIYSFSGTLYLYFFE
jgi:hypothetical protein